MRKVFPEGMCDLVRKYKLESSFYFHWPFCRKLCTYCNFNKYVESASRFGTNFENSMKNNLLRETETVLKSSHITKTKSIYFGGGTPSLTSSSTIKSMIEKVKDLTFLKKDAEVTVECNPSSSNMLSKLEDYSKIGVNRISIGLQSLNDGTLKLLGRDHTSIEGLTLLRQAHEVFGKDSVSVDMLYGKPGDTLESWREELEQILSYHPSHISLYELTPERGTHLFKQLKSGMIMLPDSTLTASMYQLAVELMQQSQLERYEASSFAKTGAESEHNFSYWNGTQYVGIGPGAHSRLYVKEHSSREARIQCLDPKLWIDRVQRNGHGTQICKRQKDLEVLSELLVTSLRTKKGTQQERWQIFELEYSIQQIFQRSSKIQKLCSEGLLYWNSLNDLLPSENGLNVIDAILPIVLNELDCFFAGLGTNS